MELANTKIILNNEKKKFLRNFYEKNQSQIINFVNQTIKGYGGIYNKDMDDFYSLANEILCKSVISYQPAKNISFFNFFKSCYIKKVKTEMTRRNSLKRKIDREALSYDAPLNGDGSFSYEDIIQDKHEDYEKQAELLLNELFELLNRKEKIVLEMLINGYTTDEICKKHNFNKSVVIDAKQAFKSYDFLNALEKLGIVRRKDIAKWI